MGRFTKVKESTFQELQLDAGVLLNSFDPENPSFDDSSIICATTGGINPVLSAEYSDQAEDVDNAPNGMMEFMKLDSWTPEMSFTALNITPETIALSLGAADVEGMKVTPRRNIKLTDFKEVWWVGDLSNGGFAAIHLLNALSTGGFSLQTTKNGKGNLSVTLRGHVSINEQDRVPMEFYVGEPTDDDEIEP